MRGLPPHPTTEGEDSLIDEVCYEGVEDEGGEGGDVAVGGEAKLSYKILAPQRG